VGFGVDREAVDKPLDGKVLPLVEMRRVILLDYRYEATGARRVSAP
jgi:hypothetical protein